MSGESPVVELYDSNGTPLSVQNGVAIPANTPALLFAGSDGTNSRYMLMDSSGRPVMVGAGTAGSPAGGVVSIQGVASGTVVPITGTVGATQNGNIDAGNSSTATLVGNGTFTGTGLDVSVYGLVTVFVFTDQTGTLNIEWSTNNTNWDDVNSYSVSASTALSVQFGPQARFFRVVYQNGSTAQGSFRLQTIERPITAFPETVPASYTITNSDNVLLTKTLQGTSPWVDNITQFGGTNLSTGTGAGGAGIPRVTVSNDSNILATQSGTWTVAQGAPNTTANSWPIEITDGTHGPVAVKAASTAAVAADLSLVTAFSPNSPLPTGSNVIGAVTQSAGPWTENLTQVASNAVATAATGVQKVGIVGGTGTSLETTAGVVDHNLKNVGNAAVTTLAAGEQKVAVEGLAASGSATSGNPVLVAGADPLTTRTLLTDTSGRQVVVGAAATGGAVAGFPVLIAGQADNGGVVEVTTVNQDKVAYTPAKDFAPFTNLADRGAMSRFMAGDRFGSPRFAKESLEFWDPVEGSTVNTIAWAQSTTTMTIAQATGAITLNNGAITTISTDAILTSNRQFPLFVDGEPISASFRAEFTTVTNSVQELGFGAPSGTTATLTNGVFIRNTSAGVWNLVISFNSTETSTALTNLQTGAALSLSSSSYYIVSFYLDGPRVEVVIETSSGVAICDQWVAAPVGNAAMTAVTHLPIFYRLYNTGSAPASAPKMLIGGTGVYTKNADLQRPRAHQASIAGREAGINPTTFAQTTQLNNASAPTAFTPSNTAAGNAFLGGEAVVNMTATSEALLSIFAFQVPSPYTLMLDSSSMPSPVITTSIAASPTILEMVLITNASSGNLSTATGQIRRSLGWFEINGTGGTNSAGGIFNGGPLNWTPQTPVVCYPGTFVHLAVKVITAGSAQGALRYAWNVGGYFE